MNHNVDAVAGKLVKAGIPVTGIFRTTEPDLEDDMIKITDTVHVQVSSYGDCYSHVVQQDGDDYIFYPERLSVELLVRDVKRILGLD